MTARSFAMPRSRVTGSPRRMSDNTSWGGIRSRNQRAPRGSLSPVISKPPLGTDVRLVVEPPRPDRSSPRHDGRLAQDGFHRGNRRGGLQAASPPRGDAAVHRLDLAPPEAGREAGELDGDEVGDLAAERD